MHRLTFYPLGNADCCLIDLANGQKILFDYADIRCEDDAEDLRIPLGEELRKNLKDANRDFFDVVAFTHLDNDHICKSSEFFHLEHAEKYQGEGRIKIREPAGSRRGRNRRGVHGRRSNHSLRSASSAPQRKRSSRVFSSRQTEGVARRGRFDDGESSTPVHRRRAIDSRIFVGRARGGILRAFAVRQAVKRSGSHRPKHRFSGGTSDIYRKWRGDAGAPRVGLA